MESCKDTKSELKTFIFHYIGETMVKPSNGYAEEGWKDFDGNKKYVEYEGFTCESRDKKEAWDIFLSTDGKFGIPDHRDYDIEER